MNFTRIGRLTRPDGPFVLRPGLAAPGQIGFAEAAKDVTASWRRQAATGQVNKSTVDTHSRRLTLLARYVAKQSNGKVCDVDTNLLLDWLYTVDRQTLEQPTKSVQAGRRATAVAFFNACYLLGITNVNPAQALPSVTKPARFVHPLTGSEVEHLKGCAGARAKDTLPQAAVALLLLGCSAGEIGSIRCTDIRLTDMLVWSHGGSERYEPRWLPIDDPWCFGALAARVKAVAEEFPDDWEGRTLVYTPRGGVSAGDWRQAAAATSRTVTQALKRAGLKVDGETRVASISEYVAGRVLAETGRVEAVATRLGLSKLDDAARLCGYDWVSDFAQSGPDDGSN